jgi:hypothetical protein
MVEQVVVFSLLHKNASRFLVGLFDISCKYITSHFLPSSFSLENMFGEKNLQIVTKTTKLILRCVFLLFFNSGSRRGCTVKFYVTRDIIMVWLSHHGFIISF